MYSPPGCSEVNFNIGLAYTPPLCGSINFNFILSDGYVLSQDNTEILIKCSSDDIFSGIYFSNEDSEIIIKASSHDIEILTEFDSTNDEIKILCTEINIEKPSSSDLPTGIAGGFVSSWKKPIKVDVIKEISWGGFEQIIKITNTPFIDSGKIDIPVASSWKSMEDVSIRNDIPFKNFSYLDIQYSVPFSTMEIFDKSIKVVWGDAEQKDHLINVVYLQPEPNDKLISINYDHFANVDKKINVSYKQPGPQDSTKSFQWGPFSYYTLCNGLRYYPPKACEINFNFPNKYPLVQNICEGIVFNINGYSTDPRCPYDHWHSGIRDSGNGIIPRYPVEYAKPKSYYMFNEVYVQEVVTQTPIEVLSVDVKIDINSWLWSFSITVASECYLALIKPINGVMGHLKITINSYDWYCAVEGWSESRTFGSQSWTITGRSPAMMFGDPISQKISGSITEGKQGQTIIEEIVQAKQLPPYWPAVFQTWSSDFSIYNTTGKVQTGFLPYLNWYIPANTVNYTEKTEIELIKELADSIGAYIQAHRSENKLIIKPLYPHQPWNWTINNKNIEWTALSESQLREVSRSNSLKPFYQAVYVVGESIGGTDSGGGIDSSNTSVLVDVRRQEYSSSTASYAPMITSPYVTSSKAALELGRAQIAQTSEWLNHSLRLGVFCSGSGSFKLYETGDMIAVLERGLSWRGQVTSVQVVAASSGGGFGVQQTIQVQEYRGE